ncbi:hypothetical protein C8J36_101373 [Rhizobium sp. PP-F2F-G48]|uniref:hypothetical protein n=1 Tax=Rhizobium sp. PP-F2F-G48 TaxID=2135651 RepID=UPI0010E8AF2C|nr:hypothetical protein [Rhizobium sp. PP-F2F-G48]TCM58472.1 hypothetical protein C8J36_101373 [Rhizobium sp. PP-F2F-G48]
MTHSKPALRSAGPFPDTGLKLRVLRDRPWSIVLLAIVIVVLASLVAGVRATDYVGRDNDDAMRLVEVRDFLAGQGWFDTMQYRLGLEGGTLMHWSRLVDLPIAGLIAFFGLFLSPQASEAAALFVWPILLIAPVLIGVARACFNIGGRQTMVIGLILIVLSLIGNMRFQPGNIDHHNVQLALIALLMAGLTDPVGRPRGHTLAGIAAGIAIAVGVETTPLVAIAGTVIALRWAWHGERMEGAAKAFGLSIATTVTSAFLVTTPPHLYAMVTCDNLSLGFFAIATSGGLALFLSALTTSVASAKARVLALAASAAAVAVVTLSVAPQCLQNPLASLDPLLKTLWLDRVEEAQSIVQLAQTMPSYLGFGFAAGTLAILTCLVRIWRNDRRELHLVFLALCLPTLAISMLQIRGTTFLNFLSIFPLSLAVSDLRTRAYREPRTIRAELAFAGLMLMSIPSIWGLAAAAVASSTGKEATVMTGTTTSACGTRDAIAPLADEPTGLVAAPSNLGAAILRFTRHRVLAAPYHRNTAGMLAELNIGLAAPDAARELLHRDGVTLLAFCAEDGQTDLIAQRAPGGLYAALGKGIVPDYLAPVAAPGPAALKIFRVSR